MCWQKPFFFFFADWKCSCLIYKTVLMLVKVILDVVFLPSQKIICNSLIYLLMLLSSWEGQLAIQCLPHFFPSALFSLGDAGPPHRWATQVQVPKADHVGSKGLTTPSREYVRCREFPYLKVTKGSIPGSVRLRDQDNLEVEVGAFRVPPLALRRQKSVLSLWVRHFLEQGEGAW